MHFWLDGGSKKVDDPRIDLVDVRVPVRWIFTEKWIWKESEGQAQGWVQATMYSIKGSEMIIDNENIKGNLLQTRARTNVFKLNGT